jgi:amino acid adenylation domain-containing protein
LVGVCVERSADMLVALLAVANCGAAWLPLDPALPSERLQYMLDDAFAHRERRVVLTQTSLLAQLPSAVRDTAFLIDAGPAAQAAPALAPARGEDLAYLIYTSGSTGKPKGVEITQANLLNFLSAMRTRVGLQPGDVLLAVTTLSFDISGLELFLPLCSGAAVAIATREQAADPHALAALLDSTKATCMQATPATWRMLVESGWKGSPQLSALCGGEALPSDLARNIVARTRRLWNVYGPTETTIWSSIDAISADAREVTLGRPLDNTRLYVLDAQRQRLPIGAPGELWIAGAGVARGYHRRPELSAERFAPDPFYKVAKERMYATGDLVRRRADGRIEFLGRLDHQVKLRGFRIELGEIESLLRAQPQVAACAVDLREFATGDQRLIAWCVASAGGTLDADGLRSALARQLPEYMLPSAFVPLDALPMTANGKLDRKALPGVGSRAPGTQFVAPQGEVEIALARLWREVLALEQVGGRDRFFDLGGHSLLAMRAIVRMEQEFGVRVPARDLMLQNLSQLASAVTERRAGAKSAADTKPSAPAAGLMGTLRNLLGKPPKA